LFGGTKIAYETDILEDSALRKPPRLYGKDMSCPDEWTQHVASHLNKYFVYRSESDLISNLAADLQPLSLMVYVGVENNWTPGHKDICGSLGNNIMAYTDEGTII
jgi:hypothetical protein